MILNFGIAERLRTLRYPIFTGRGRDGKRQLPRWFPAETAARRVDGYAFSREKGIEIIFRIKASPGRGKLSPQVTDEGAGKQQFTENHPSSVCSLRSQPPSPQGVKAFCSSQTVKIDFRGKS